MENIIQQGELLKYIVTSQDYNFDMEVDDFTVEIIYGYRQDKIVIPKSDFLYGTQGEFVMQFPTNDMIGKVIARMIWQQHDTDCDHGVRPNVDEQVIAFVVATPYPTLLNCPKSSNAGHFVRYERTETPDIAEMYLRLVATEIVTPEHGEPYTIYRPLITRNDEYLYALRETAEQIQDALSNLQNNNQ